MKKMGIGLLGACAVFTTAICLLTMQPLRAAEPSGGAAVEDDMHEFMEYVFQPTYKRLKVAMATAPADKKGWKPIKADALILAEGGNLLLLRTPEDEGAQWEQFSLEVRKSGGELYRAAKKGDYTAAQSHYQAMIKSCNACHQEFAGGEYQLKP